MNESGYNLINSNYIENNFPTLQDELVQLRKKFLCNFTPGQIKVEFGGKDHNYNTPAPTILETVKQQREESYNAALQERRKKTWSSLKQTWDKDHRAKVAKYFKKYIELRGFET